MIQMVFPHFVMDSYVFSPGPMSPLSPSDDKPKRGRKKGWNKVKAIEKVTKAETMDADRKSLEGIDFFRFLSK